MRRQSRGGGRPRSRLSALSSGLNQGQGLCCGYNCIVRLTKARESKSIVQPVDLGGANLLVETVGDNLTNVND